MAITKDVRVRALVAAGALALASSTGSAQAVRLRMNALPAPAEDEWEREKRLGREKWERARLAMANRERLARIEETRMRDERLRQAKQSAQLELEMRDKRLRQAKQSAQLALLQEMVERGEELPADTVVELASGRYGRVCARRFYFVRGKKIDCADDESLVYAADTVEHLYRSWAGVMGCVKKEHIKVHVPWELLQYRRDYKAWVEKKEAEEARPFAVAENRQRDEAAARARELEDGVVARFQARARGRAARRAVVQMRRDAAGDAAAAAAAAEYGNITPNYIEARRFAALLDYTEPERVREGPDYAPVDDVEPVPEAVRDEIELMRRAALAEELPMRELEPAGAYHAPVEDVPAMPMHEDDAPVDAEPMREAPVEDYPVGEQMGQLSRAGRAAQICKNVMKLSTAATMALLAACGGAQFSQTCNWLAHMNDVHGPIALPKSMELAAPLCQRFGMLPQQQQHQTADEATEVVARMRDLLQKDTDAEAKMETGAEAEAEA